ncbi:MAG: ATP-binding protein, partial [Bacteroidota bacterium]
IPQIDVFMEGGDLMKQGAENKRLYLIEKGSLIGYLKDDKGKPFEIFRSTTGMFVGVYSFFSKTYASYATIVANEDSQLAYIDTSVNVVEDEACRSFVEHFMPIIVNELSARQKLAREVALEKERTLTRLLQHDKMATLGEMAAGLAHELNNAVGVLQRKTEWLSEELSTYLRDKDSKGMFPFFEKGLEVGQALSSSEVRKKRKELEQKLGLSAADAQKIARTGIAPQELDQVLSEDMMNAERLYYYWEIGTAFHDMLLAANHAVHVVKSVKQLGASSAERQHSIQVVQTIEEALALLKSPLRKVILSTDLQEVPEISASNGELVQVWVNIIKNGIESMENSNTPSPQLSIVCKSIGNCIQVLIEDNGPGIPKAIQSKIFEPHFSTKSDSASVGLGLGLAIVRRLIESYHGKIGVKSQIGKTVFKVLLPINQDIK